MTDGHTQPWRDLQRVRIRLVEPWRDLVDEQTILLPAGTVLPAVLVGRSWNDPARFIAAVAAGQTRCWDHDSPAIAVLPEAVGGDQR
jgi:hypothetical protein